MARGNTFDDRSTRRIIRAVRAVEAGYVSGAPIATRRVPRSGGGAGGTTIYIGYLTADVPAMSSVDDCVTLEEFTTTANWYEDQLVDETPVVVGAINRTPQDLRGSETLPTPVWGIMRTANVETSPAVFESRRRLEIIWSFNAGLPGHETDSGSPQAPKHDDGSDSYYVDGRDCTA